MIGAAVGAVGGLGGGWLSVLGQGRRQRQQLLGERERWRYEMRRDAYNACIASTKRLSFAWRRAADQLRDPNSTSGDWHDRFGETHEAWVEFSGTVAAVSVAGPRAAADAVDRLRMAMYDWDRIGTLWYHEAIRQGNGRLDDFDTRFKAAAGAKQSPDRVFLEVARQALGTEV